MNLLFLDTETTDLEDRRLVQLAYKKYGSDDVFDQMYKPPISIKPGASEQNHIVDEDVADCPPFQGSDDAAAIRKLLEDHILIAHNAEFDISVLKNEGVETKYYICTQKIAQSILDDPKIEKFSMQFLRYFLGLYKTEPNPRYIAHDAYGDIMVLEQLFIYLFSKMKHDSGLEEREVITKMINISMNPLLLRRVNFGKHAGMLWSELAQKEPSYLTWIRDKKDNKSPDELFTVNYYLDKIYNTSNARVV